MYRDNSDAFSLNVGREDWQRARVADAYAAALQLQTDFKLFLSLDMT
jgi:glucan endo-1,3-alpha-glucosidase